MKNILFLSIIFLFATQFSQGQEKTNQDAVVTKLVKDLYAKDIDKRLGFVLEMKQQENPEETNKEVSFDEVYQDIYTLYEEKYTAQEIRQLATFYASPLGKKTLANQATINAKVSKIMMHWELKQQGINLEDPALDEPLLIAEVNLQKPDSLALKNAKLAAASIKGYPKINSLEDLRKILLKDPFVVSDLELLKEILGKEVDLDKLMDPAFEAFENEVNKNKK